ncbi:MAG TPA: peptidylprolyl isomerase, partial [Tepidisphaeraceae bacterium]
MSRPSVVSRKRGASSRAVEPLEQRTFLNATLVQPIAAVNGSPSGSTTIDLTQNFNDPTVTGTTVEIQTPKGNIPLTLFDSQTPKTVANFEHYISAGEYNNVIIHRSVPGFVIQGGGYTTSGSAISTFAPVQGEPGISNTTGTIAMALSTSPNSG